MIKKCGTDVQNPPQTRFRKKNQVMRSLDQSKFENSDNYQVHSNPLAYSSFYSVYNDEEQEKDEKQARETYDELQSKQMQLHKKLRNERKKEMMERRSSPFNPYMLTRKSQEYKEIERKLKTINQEVNTLQRNYSHLKLDRVKFEKLIIEQ